MKNLLPFYKKLLLICFSSFVIVFCSNAQSLRFTDTSYVNLGNHASLKLTSFTLEAWIKIEGYGSTTITGTGGVDGVIPIITKGRAQAETPSVDINYFLGYRLSDMKLIADFEDNPGSVNHPVISNGTLPYCTWTHVAATYDPVSAVWKLYINGVLDNTLDIGTNILPQSASDINACIGSTLGTDASQKDGFFNGRIDEVRIWNVVRTDAQISSNYNAELTSGTGLANRWGLNEGAGSTATNSIVSGPTGALIRNPLWVSGFNQADPTTNASIDLNGVHDYITFGKADGTAGNPSLNVSPNFSLEAWIKREGTGVTASTGTGGFVAVPILAKGRGESDATQNLNMNYFLGIDAAGKLAADFEETTGPNHPVISVATIPLGIWTHVAATYNNSTRTWKLFINGVLDITEGEPAGNPPVNNSIQHASIGTAMNSSGVTEGLFNGKIDEVRIWNITRTDADIIANYNAEITSGAGLVARYGFNENCGLLAVNSVAGGSTGSIISNNISTHPTNGGPTWVSSGFNNQAPSQPINPSPANNAQAPSTSPNICATVSDPNGGNVRTRFYGRPKPAGGSVPFTIVLFPDTQFYTSEMNGGTIGMFNAQTAWVANNRVAKNIVYVGQLGDCVQNGDAQPVEWTRAVTAMSTIESQVLTGLPQGVPFGISVGNHDQSIIGDAASPSFYYNQYFGEAHFTGRSYYGGHYGTDPLNNDNHYQLFSTGGIDFLVISLEYDDRAAFATGLVLDWAEGLVQTYSTRKVIVMTHNLMNESAVFSTQGQAIFNRLSPYTNVIMLHGGHVSSLTGGEAMRADFVNGRTLYSILTDYQSRTNGGNGLLRYYEFDPILNTVAAKTYSPHTLTSETDANSQFSLTMNLNTFSFIGETTVASGSQTCVNWPSLAQFTDYEWYVELYDGENTTTGPVWTFTTPANSPLPVNIIAFDARTENNKKVKITWTTTYERDNSHFEVQRSKDGINFISIATVPARNNSNSLENYSLYDDQPLKGISFYRLKQIDIDTRTSYTKTEKVKIIDPAGGVDIFPNPATGNTFNINITGNIKGAIDVRVIDMGGRLHLQQQYNSGNIIIVNHRLPAGTYMVKITGEGLDENKKLVIK